MTQDYDYKEIVQNSLDSLALSGEKFADYFHSDGVFHAPTVLVPQNTQVGKDNIRTMMYRATSYFEDDRLTITIDRMLQDGDTVICLAHGKARTLWGTDYNNSYCFLFEFEGSKFKKVTEYSDSYHGYIAVINTMPESFKAL